MTKDELIARLRDIEWDDFEVKCAKSELPRSVWETVSAFSNCSGGWLVLGVKQTGKTFEVTGVDNIEKLEQDFFGVLRSRKFNVPLFANAYRYNVDGHRVLAFYIPSSDIKPVYYNALENTFVRMGSGDQKATPSEIMAMFRDQSFGSKSQQSIPNTDINMLSREALTDFRGEVRHWGFVPHLDNVSDEDFCSAVGITDYEGRLTYGGLIMLGRAPYTFTFVPTFCADYVEIPGTGVEALTKNYAYRIPEQQNLWEASRIIARRLRTLVNTPMTGINERGQSVEDLSVYNILREAMANQMTHADHFSIQRSCIHVFDDRIEFINPGAMPKPIDEMERAFESLPRNPVIAKLFRLAKLSENLGYGLRKLKSWTEVTGLPMHMETTISSVKVVFELTRKSYMDVPVNDPVVPVNDPVVPVNDPDVPVNDPDVPVNDSDVPVNIPLDIVEKLTDRQLQLIRIITDEPSLSRTEIADRLHVTLRTIGRDLAELSGIVRYSGPQKGGHWEIITREKEL